MREIKRQAMHAGALLFPARVQVGRDLMRVVLPPNLLAVPNLLPPSPANETRELISIRRNRTKMGCI